MYILLFALVTIINYLLTYLHYLYAIINCGYKQLCCHRLLNIFKIKHVFQCVYMYVLPNELINKKLHVHVKVTSGVLTSCHWTIVIPPNNCLMRLFIIIRIHICNYIR